MSSQPKSKSRSLDSQAQSLAEGHLHLVDVLAQEQSGSHSRTLSPEAQSLAEEHLHLVDLLAREQYRLCKGTVPLEELLGEARWALTYASSIFDRAREVPFGAYATLVMRHRLIQAVTTWRRGGRLAHVRFSDLNQRNPEGEVIPYQPVCPRTREPVQLAAERELLERVRRALPPRWFAVLYLYFAEGHTLEEIGRRLRLSRQRVQQLVVRALDRARRCA
jgi:RNA polymerase sigma factor (sigma-70 family)